MKSARITLAQTRHAWQLLGDARDLRHRPTEQAVTIVDGLCRLFGADNGFMIAVDDYRPGGRLTTKAFHYGTVKDPVLHRWFEGRLGFEKSLNDDIMVVHTLGRRARSTVITQDAIWPKLRPNDYPAFAEIIRMYRLRDNLVMMFRPGAGHDTWGFAVHRRDARHPYSPAQCRLAGALAKELRRLHDTGRLTPGTDPAAGLPPRPAEVLGHLLAGRSPARIALLMGLSVHTVRDHVKVLFDHFGVHGTQELLARLLAPVESSDD